MTPRTEEIRVPPANLSQAALLAAATEDEFWAQADMNIHRMKVSGELQRRADHRALLDQIQNGNLQ